MRARLAALAAVLLLIAVVAGAPCTTAPARAQSRTVTVATHDLTPFVMTRGAIKSGFTIDLIDEVAKRAGWTVTYTDVHGGVAAELKAVADGTADAAAGAISITAQRAQTYDFSQPILAAGLQILVSSAETQHSTTGISDFLRLLFSKAVLVWLAAALVLTVVPAHLIWLLERRNTDSMVSRRYFPGIFQAFGWGLGMLAAQPENFPRHWISRVITVLLAFVSIIFVAYYTATLTANLTVDKINTQISSPADLFGRQVCTVANTTSAAFLKNFGVTPDAAAAIDDCFAGITGHRYEAVVFDSPVLRYYAAHDGAGIADLVGPVFQPEDYGVAFTAGSPLRRQFDEQLLTIREDGTYDLIKGKWFGSDGSGGG